MMLNMRSKIGDTQMSTEYEMHVAENKARMSDYYAKKAAHTAKQHYYGQLIFLATKSNAIGEYTYKHKEKIHRLVYDQLIEIVDELETNLEALEEMIDYIQPLKDDKDLVELLERTFETSDGLGSIANHLILSIEHGK